MFVTPRNGVLLLVTQQAHAAMCGELLHAWGNVEFDRPEPFDSVLTAVRRHDDGWIEPDSEPLTNPATNRPLHVLDVELRDHTRFFGAGVERVVDDDAYAGLLVGMHWTGLYRGRWGLGPSFDPVRSREAGLDDVIATQELSWIQVRHELMASLQVRRSDFEAQLWSNYDLLQALDLLSIFLCTHFSGANQLLPSVPAGKWRESQDVELVAIDDNIVRVTPFPFADDAVEVSVDGWEIEDREYDGPAEVRQVLDETHRVTVRRRLVR